jgi:hypothetical protein
MNGEEIISKFWDVLPEVKKWIEELLEIHATNSVPVRRLGFRRLPQYFPDNILEQANVVIVPKVPFPPLGRLGLRELSFMEQTAPSGITYLNTIFIHDDNRNDESLHFHELVHVIQWDRLGMHHFLLTYGVGIVQFGYKKSPLEQMAFQLQQKFDNKEKIPKLLSCVNDQTDEIWDQTRPMLIKNAISVMDDLGNLDYCPHCGVKHSAEYVEEMYYSDEGVGFPAPVLCQKCTKEEFAFAEAIREEKDATAFQKFETKVFEITMNAFRMTLSCLIDAGVAREDNIKDGLPPIYEIACFILFETAIFLQSATTSSLLETFAPITLRNTKAVWANYISEHFHLDKTAVEQNSSAMDARIRQYHSDIEQFVAETGQERGSFNSSCLTLLGYLDDWSEYELSESDQVKLLNALQQVFANMSRDLESLCKEDGLASDKTRDD